MPRCAIECAISWHGSPCPSRLPRWPASKQLRVEPADSVARVKIANLYAGRSGELAIGHIKGVWHDLGREAGTLKVGLRRIEVEEGYFSTPAHEHGADEEIFFVLGGEGLLWQDGETYTVGGGDCIVHRPKRGPHTLRAGAGGLDVLVFGQRLDPSLTALPRAGVVWSFPRWVELSDKATRHLHARPRPGLQSVRRPSPSARPTSSPWTMCRRSSRVGSVAPAKLPEPWRLASITWFSPPADRAPPRTATPRRRSFSWCWTVAASSSCGRVVSGAPRSIR